MNKEQLTQLQKLSRKEKLKLVHLLWDDIAREQDDLSIPTEHRQVIDERLAKIKSANASFRSWDDIQTKYKSA
jgi:putative addiction module component (TIGR02574 family)